MVNIIFSAVSACTQRERFAERSGDPSVTDESVVVAVETADVIAGVGKSGIDAIRKAKVCTFNNVCRLIPRTDTMDLASIRPPPQATFSNTVPGTVQPRAVYLDSVVKATRKGGHSWNQLCLIEVQSLD